MSSKPLFAVFLLVCVIISISAASAAEPTKIAIGGSYPAIYENKVVWVDDTGNLIHLYDLSTKQDTPIVSSQVSNLDIYGNTLAWLDKSGDAPKLVIYDIGAAETFSLAEGSADDYSRPAIYGDRVVWSANGTVYEVDIPNMIQTTIVTGRDPDIYGNKIAYATMDDEGHIIKVYDTSTKETINVPYRGVVGNPYIYGDKVIWSDSYTRAGNMIMYDLVTGIVTVVTSDSTEINGLESGCDTGDNKIYGDKIVYAKLTDDGLGNAGIYVYDIPDAKNEMIFRTGDNTGAMLDIYGNTIVWEYAGDIYTFNMVENSLNAPSPQITSATIDPLTGVPEDGTATIKVTVKNNGGKSSAGYISVSFPNNEEITSTEGTNGNAKIYPVGSEIWGKDGIIDSSKNPLVELEELDWESGQEETLTIEVKPNEGSNEIVFLVRATLKNDATGDYERDPVSSGEIDQQGWYAYKHTIDVDFDEVKLRGTFLEDRPLISVYDISVKIKEILDDPTGKLKIGDTIHVSGARTGPAKFDATPGDEVEVFGEYRWGTVFLSDFDDTSSDHYMIKIEIPSTAYEDLTIVHFTDVHMGFNLWDSSSEKLELKRQYFSDALQDIKELNPDSILVTGDIVEYNLDYFFRDFTTIIENNIPNNNINNKIFCTPGNHDRRSGNHVWFGSLDDYNKLIAPSYPVDKNLLGTNGDYYVNLGGYLFIGLDSGEDTSCESFDGTPEGSGLTVDQLESLWVLDPEIPKVIFMHHPVITGELDNEEEDSCDPIVDDHLSGNNHCIANLRPEFIDYCKNNNVLAVLTGHTHHAFIYDKDAVLVELRSLSSTYGPTYNAPYFVQTQSLTKDAEKDGIKFNHGYSIVNIEDGKLHSIESVETSLKTRWTGILACPANLHVYNSQGRHTGLNNGDPEFEILDSFYYSGYDIDLDDETKIHIPETIILYDMEEDYTFQISANFTEEDVNSPEDPHFNFTLEKQVGSSQTKISYVYVPLTTNTVATVQVNNDTTEYLMQIDDNGDGVVDQTKEPDEISILRGENKESSDESSSDSSHSSSSSGGSSGGGGGGGGGSPEPAKNVEVKELAQTFITNGKEAKFEFRKNATCVVYVNFDAKRNLGKTTTIVEQLKGKSALVPELPEGEVYKSFNVWVGNGGIATPENIENPAICFRVEKSWLQDNSVDSASITLNRYNDEKWEQFKVNMSGEDAKYLYFTADVSGFSSFAIIGKAKSTSEQNEENLPSARSVNLTNEADDTGIKSEAEKSTPGFEMVFGILCLLGVFLYRRK